MKQLFVGLHDAEFEHIKDKSFPNYALMKISAWHKQRGDTVEMFTPIDPNAAEQLTLFPLEEYPLKRKANIYMADTRHSLYGKMLAVLSAAIKGTTSALCLKKSQTPIFQCLKAEDGQPPEWFEVAKEGQALLGDCLILSFGVSPNVANESSLSEILEPNAHPKYSLSPKASLGILTRADRKKKELPLLLSAILKLRAGLKKTVVLQISDEPPTESTLTPTNQGR